MTTKNGNLSESSISNQKFYYEWGDKNNCEKYLIRKAFSEICSEEIIFRET